MVSRNKRCFFILSVFALAMFLLVFKMYLIDFVEKNKIISTYNFQNFASEKTSDVKFNILDCNGKQLLKYKLEYYVVVNPYAFLKNNSDSNMYDLRALTYILKNYNSKYDLLNDNIKNENLKLYWKVDETTYEKVNKIKDVNGVYSYTYYKVNRDEASDICNILTNFKNNNNADKAKSSLETEIQNKTEGNSYPEKIFENDKNGNLSSIKDKKDNNNINLKLTIDKSIEDKVKSVLNDSEFKDYPQIGAVVMESSTGKIRALEQKDMYKGNMNAGIGDGYLFPGSIFKIIVEEAALNNKLITPSQIFTDDGRYSETGRKGEYNVSEAFTISSNEVFMKIGNITGFNNIYKVAKDEGIFDKVLGLNYEQYGILNMDPFSVGDMSLLSIGQKFRITPLEAISLPNTVINNGVYVKPWIIEGYVNSDDNIVYAGKTYTNRITDENTANIIKNQMREVVQNGTGKLAYVEGNDTGGKTGTSTRIENKNQNHVDAWFAGFFKIKDKYYSTVIMVPDINNDEEAGNTAAPIFKKMVQELNK